MLERAFISLLFVLQAYELSTLTGTQVLLLVASETGHVYTFATRKLQPMITSETGKALIQTCLNSPDSPPRSDPSSDQRMSATGFEETDLTYQVSEADGCTEVAKVTPPSDSIGYGPVTVGLYGLYVPVTICNIYIYIYIYIYVYVYVYVCVCMYVCMYAPPSRQITADLCLCMMSDWLISNEPNEFQTTRQELRH